MRAVATETRTPSDLQPYLDPGSPRFSRYPRRGLLHLLRSLFAIYCLVLVACVAFVVSMLGRVIATDGIGALLDGARISRVFGADARGPLVTLYPLVAAGILVVIVLLAWLALWSWRDGRRERLVLRSRAAQIAFVPPSALPSTETASAGDEAALPGGEDASSQHEPASAPAPVVIATPQPPAARKVSAASAQVPAASRVDRPIRVFVSHSSQDNDRALRIVTDLRRALGDHDAVWFDASGGLHAGDGWPQRIELELTERPVFVVMLSPRAMQSDWVRDEIALALELKNSPRKTVIVPVLLETCEVSGFLSLVQYVSFAELPYEQAFEELLFAVRFGQTRMREAAQRAGIRLGPPMGVLPLAGRFVGRGDELAWVMERLRRREVTGITTLNGLAGIGKTALAAEAIKQARAEGLFPDGIAVVICLGRTDATGVLRDVLAPFSDEAIPEDADLVQLARIASALLERKRALVVLDNVEPELEVTKVVEPLRALGVSLLLTARQTLPRAAVPAGSDLELALLPPEKALELFATSYGREGVAALGPEERADAVRIVTALGNHTLAIVLAARYALDEKRPLETVAREMENPQRALDLPQDETPEGVRRAFASSVASLPEDARKLFAALAAFATPEFGRRAAVALAEGLGLERPEDAVDLLVRRALADNTLNAGMPEESDRERLRLHPLLFAFAGYLFAQLPLTEAEREAAHLALARWYAAYANATPDPVLIPDEANVAGALERMHEQGQDALVVALTDGMQYYWRDRSRNQERRRYLPWGIAAAERIATTTNDTQDRLALARLLLTYGDLLLTLGRTSDAEQQLRRSLEIRREAGDTRGEGIALSQLGDILRQRGDLAGAQANYEHFLQTMRAVGDQREEGVALAKLGDILVQRGDLAGAQANYEHYLQTMRAVGDQREEGVALSLLGDILVQRGDLAGAQANYEHFLQTMRAVGDQRGEGVALFKLGQVAEAGEALEDAEEYYRQGLLLLRDVQEAFSYATGARLFGAFLIERREKHTEGCAWLHEAIQIYARMGLAGEESEAREAALRLGCGE